MTKTITPVSFFFGANNAGGYCSLYSDAYDSYNGGNHIILKGGPGTGKSTLMSVLFGMYQPEQGEIFVSGKKVVMKNPQVATDNGISVVHQERNLIPTFNIAENAKLFLDYAKEHGDENLILGVMETTWVPARCFMDGMEGKEVGGSSDTALLDGFAQETEE